MIGLSKTSICLGEISLPCLITGGYPPHGSIGSQTMFSMFDDCCWSHVLKNLEVSSLGPYMCVYIYYYIMYCIYIYVCMCCVYIYIRLYTFIYLRVGVCVCIWVDPHICLCHSVVDQSRADASRRKFHDSQIGPKPPMLLTSFFFHLISGETWTTTTSPAQTLRIKKF